MTPRQEFHERGYYVARALLTKDETGTLRALLRDHFSHSGVPFGLGLHQPDAGRVIPGLDSLFAHPGIRHVLHDLAAGQTIAFTGNSDAHRNVLNRAHRDFLFDTGDDGASSSARLIRVGVYLQDHATDHRGLHVHPGSHRQEKPSDGDPVYVRTHAGDVTFHDVRLVHSGARPDRVERTLERLQRCWRSKRLSVALHNRWIRLSGMPDKLALFFTYGMPGPETDAFCQQHVGEQQNLLNAG